MVDEIKEKLIEIEREYNVRILYACESGSRAWGFPSIDSDFDVRFIYAHSKDWYLSIDNHKDTIDIPVNEILDINGWDLRKALKLFRNANAPLYEWLQSPIVYRKDGAFTSSLKEVMPDFFSLRAGMHHYLSMARNAFAELISEEVKIKKYFYCLRPLLASIWIAEKRELPPMEFAALRTLVADSLWQQEIDVLLEKKANANEKSLTRPVPILHAFIEDRIEYCNIIGKEIPKKEAETEKLNILFRTQLYDF